MGSGSKTTPFVRQRRVAGWQLGTAQPRIVLGQMRSVLKIGAPDGHRISVEPTDDYRDALFSVLKFAAAADADFVLFPEYAWPAKWAADIAKYIRKTRRTDVCYVIPFEHLSYREYDRVMSTFGVDKTLKATELQDVRDHVPGASTDDIIVNAVMICIRVRRGIHVVPQRKLRPAQLEEIEATRRWRFAGSNVTRLLKGRLPDKTTFSFATMICFDAIARMPHSSDPLDAVLAKRPSLVFIPECNPSPLHDSYTRAAFKLTSNIHVPPVLFFCNIARRSELAISESRLGFSRVLGELGTVAPRDLLGAVLVEGVLKDSGIKKLDDIRHAKSIFFDKTLRSLFLRPEETVALIQLPPLGEHPSPNPQFGRSHTTVDLHHYTGKTHGWIRMLEIDDNAERPLAGIPYTAYLVKWPLLSVETPRERLAELLDAMTPLMWISGDGGVGKTALAAKLLDEVARNQRIIWIDLGQIQYNEHALLETLLFALNRAEALTRSHDDQLEILKEVASTEATTFVLDSFDRWSEKNIPFPSWITKVAGWNRRFVVTSRTEDSAPENAEIIPLTALSEESAVDLICAVAETKVPPSYSLRMARTMGNLPLGCVWAGELYRSTTQEALHIAERLANAPEALESLFHACVDDLDDIDRDVLGVICTLKAPVLEGDIAEILKADSDNIRVAWHRLVSRNLAMNFGDDAAPLIHYRHPFVRQFWRAANGDDPYFAAITAWAELLAQRYGGERNWRGLPELESRWNNLGYVVRLFEEQTSEAAQRTFLRLWRGFDTFLWTSKRWRERLAFGETALRVSRLLRDRLSEGHALYESLAQPKWHMRRQEGRQEAEPLIREAIKTFADIGDGVELARAQWYLSRMLLACKEPDQALIEAERALKIAEAIPGKARAKKHCLGLAYHGIGNALRVLKRVPEAHVAYHRAQRLFRETKDWEMVAVVSRRIGQTYLDSRDYGHAVVELTNGVKAFREMRITLEEAETLNLHARAMAGLQNIEEARAEHKWADAVLRPLGSQLRNDELDETLQFINALDDGSRS